MFPELSIKLASLLTSKAVSILSNESEILAAKYDHAQDETHSLTDRGCRAWLNLQQGLAKAIGL